MKKLNSIDYGGKVIAVGLGLLIALPAALMGLHWLLPAPALRAAAIAAHCLGAAVELGFGALLCIELRQDRIINEYYRRHPQSAKAPQEILDARRRRSTRPPE